MSGSARSSAERSAHERSLRLLNEVLTLPERDRPARLDEACAGDPALRQELDEMLELAENDTGGVLETPLWSIHQARRTDEGRQIGPYRLVRQLGRGGMGVVYLAERQDGFRQRVALKLIKRGMDTDEIVGRFLNERQILAELDHPAIARLFDGGATDDGLPYFAMELVEGEPIDVYCERRGLGVRQRLELFLEVCGAVHAAHQNLVVHRDLKPGNILVSADGTLKLLDFGIAKLLAPTESATPSATVTRLQAFTPRYASPEQIRGERVTTASDVYSLGALLYQLLTGQSPHALEDHGIEYAVFARTVCEEEPRPPSAVYEKDRHELRGDIDAIILKAIRHEPEKRYGSVAALADDIRLHLDGQPVGARAGTFLYRAGRLLRRHKLALAMLLLVAGSTLVTAFGATLLWREAARDRDRQLVNAEISARFLQNLFQGERWSNQEVVEFVREKVVEVLGDDPRWQAETLEKLSRTYRKLGLFEGARILLEESVRLSERSYDGDHPEWARRLNELGTVEYQLGHYDEAAELFRQALEMRLRPGSDEAELCKNMNNLAATEVQLSHYEPAEALYRRCLDIRERLYPPGSKLYYRVADSLHSLGVLLYSRMETGGSEELLREALEIRLDVFESDHLKLAVAFNNLGAVLHAQGQHEEAETLYTRALDIRRRLLREDHVDTAHTQRNLAALYVDTNFPETARVLIEKALATFRRTKGDDDWTVADAESILGAVWAALGRDDLAGPCLLDSHERLLESRGDGVIYTRDARRRLDHWKQAPAD